MSDETPSEDTYIFIISYEDDAERKRAEYLFNNWEDGTIEAPGGFVRIASDVDHDKLYERLASKLPVDQVDSFRLESVEADVDQDRYTVNQTVNAPADTVESFVEYVLSKKKAVLQSAKHNEYEIYTKKGRGEVTYQLTENDGQTTVTMTVEGYPPAPEFLADFFTTELSDYAQSQQ